MNKEKILIIDDKETICQVLSDILKTEDYETVTAASGEEGIEVFECESPDLILTDMRMNGMSGVELILEIRKRSPAIPIILLTAFGSISSAVEAIKAGANDYLTKPLNYDLLKLKIEKILEEKRFRLENSDLKDKLKEQWGLDSMIGKSSVMKKMFTMIRTVAPTESGVLIQGECGTGKELIARSIYINSRRMNGPFIVVDCSAIPEALIESELFGYEKGAFSGADSRKKGRIEEAMNGTLFLDEIGELPLSCQAKLLRVIQEKQFVRIGGNGQVNVDFRLIAATNKNLKDEVSAGKFRSDLFYRLNVICIESPPLRDRMEDMPLLVDSFINLTCEKNNLQQKQIGRRHLSKMMDYEWPGNIRELKNGIERLLILDSLPIEIENAPERSRRTENLSTLHSSEKVIVSLALEKAGWNVTRAAQDLGIGRKVLYNRIKKYDLNGPKGTTKA